MLQYSEFLRDFTSIDQYSKVFDNLRTFCFDYGLEPEVAFHWLRPKYHQALKTSIQAADAAAEQADKGQTNSTDEMSVDTMQEDNNTTSESQTNVATESSPMATSTRAREPWVSEN
jgi:hypothetical protein